jgi:hypothetical protein
MVVIVKEGQAYISEAYLVALDGCSRCVIHTESCFDPDSLVPRVLSWVWEGLYLLNARDD